MNLKHRMLNLFDRLPLLDQYHPMIPTVIGDVLKEYVHSGKWLTEGEFTGLLETKIAEICHRKHCVMVPSGTMGLILAVRVLMEMNKKRLKIAVPDFTHPATANAVTFADSQAIPLDVDPDDWGIGRDVITLMDKKVIDAVILVDINGRIPARAQEIEDLAVRKGVFIIEDACQAFNSYDKDGKVAGSIGEMSVLSFSPHKIVTCGQGGAVLCDDEDIYRILRRMKDFGREISGVEDYPHFGINAKFTDLQAIVLLTQIKSLGLLTLRSMFKKKLWQDIYGYEPDFVPWFLYAMPENRKQFKMFMERRKIAVRDFYPGLHTLPTYENWKKSFIYPETVNLSVHGVWLPSSFDLTADHITRIKEALHDYERKNHDVKLSRIFKEPASTT